jgi:glycosyltransferase involved in cell wall biosynthesis
MKIGLDCSAVPGERTGIGEYEYHLAHALARADGVNSYLFYILFPYSYYLLHRDLLNVDLPRGNNVRTVFRPVPVPYPALRGTWLLGRTSFFREYTLGSLDVDLVHSTSYSVPAFRNRKKKLVVTLYDLTVITHPQYHTGQTVTHALNGIRDAVRYADAIIAISEHTKRDLREYLSVPEEKLAVTHLAADPAYKPVTDEGILQSVRKKYHLPPHYILFLGALEPRKNVVSLLQAFARLPGELQKEFPLVIAGAKGWLNSDLHAVVRDLKLSGKVHFPGYIAKEDISAVYSLATVFVYPSLYEGFGLPVLEAMACGTPVISSNVSSLPEVAGDAARLVAPLSIEEIEEALKDLLAHEDLRAEMRRRGLLRSAEFTWEKCAEQTLAVYRKTGAGGN